MDHVPPADIRAVGILWAADKGVRLPVKDTPAVCKVGLISLPMPLHDLLWCAGAALQGSIAASEN